MVTNYHFHIHKIVNVSHAPERCARHSVFRLNQVNRQQLWLLIQTIQTIQKQLQLDHAQQQLLSQDLQRIAKQLEARRPQSSIIKSCLQSVAQQVEHAIAHGVSHEIVHKLTGLIGSITL